MLPAITRLWEQMLIFSIKFSFALFGQEEKIIEWKTWLLGFSCWNLSVSVSPPTPWHAATYLDIRHLEAAAASSSWLYGPVTNFLAMGRDQGRSASLA